MNYRSRSTTTRSRVAALRGTTMATRVLALALGAISCPVAAQSALRVQPDPAPSDAVLGVVLEGLPAACTRIDSSAVERRGDTITLTLRFELLPCGLPPPRDVVVPLGRFDPGRYTLVYQGIEQLVGPLPALSTGFTVVPQARLIPATGKAAGALLVLLFAAWGEWRLARRA